MDAVLTLRNLTAEAFEGNRNGEVDYRAELTKTYIVPSLGLQPGSTWSQPVDGQREASVTFGNVTTLSSDPSDEKASTGIPEIAIEASIRVVGSAGAAEAVVASVAKVMKRTEFPFELWPGITLLESIDRPPTIAVRPLIAPSPPPPSAAPDLSL